MLWAEGNLITKSYHEILSQNLITKFIKCQFMELSKLMFVAIVTALSWQQQFLQVLFHALRPSTKSQFQGINDTWTIWNYVIKMPPLYPRTSFSNRKSNNLAICSY